MKLSHDDEPMKYLVNRKLNYGIGLDVPKVAAKQRAANRLGGSPYDWSFCDKDTAQNMNRYVEL